MGDKGLFKEIGSKSVVEQIVDNIVNAIIKGDLKPGGKIPTEAELGASMNVGRNSVREAIKILVAYGVLQIKRSEGTFVRKGYDRKMLYPMLYGIILQEDSANQIIELRKIIDVGILQLAIDKMDEESMENVEQAMDSLKNKISAITVTAEIIFDADVAFHKELECIAQNSLLDGICFYVDQITRCTRTKTIQKFLDEKAIDKFIWRHQEILAVLKNGDRNRINTVVENHYKYWESVKK
jgi:DNA-binding FadR family transcriptional regulator